MKLLLVLIATLAAFFFSISKLHDDGTMILASMAEEYSVCTNVNACSDDDLAKMTHLLLEQDEYNSRMWLRVMLGLGHWRNRLAPNSSARDVSPTTYRYGWQ